MVPSLPLRRVGRSGDRYNLFSAKTEIVVLLWTVLKSVLARASPNIPVSVDRTKVFTLPNQVEVLGRPTFSRTTERNTPGSITVSSFYYSVILTKTVITNGILSVNWRDFESKKIDTN